MLRLAQFCLMAQIVLAPLLLGGARPWAMAILSIMSGLGILAVCIARKQVSIPRYLVRIWGVAAVILIWSLLQSLPIWPIQAYPFNAPQIALYPDAWMALAANLIWLTATVTLSSLLAQGQAQTLLNMGIKVLIASCALQVGLAMLASVMDWQTPFWFGKSAHLDDWTGSFANRNAFGGLMTLAAIYALCLFCGKGTARAYLGPNAVQGLPGPNAARAFPGPNAARAFPGLGVAAQAFGRTRGFSRLASMCALTPSSPRRRRRPSSRTAGRVAAAEPVPRRLRRPPGSAPAGT